MVSGPGAGCKKNGVKGLEVEGTGKGKEVMAQKRL